MVGIKCQRGAPSWVGARHNSGVHGVFGVALAILSPVGCPDWEEHRRQDPQRYHRAVRIEYARIHASGAGFPELSISMSHTLRGSVVIMALVSLI
jgi:hypothetical protein